MKKILFPLLVALSALSVSASAAFYSVYGLSKLFAGASTQVIIMAGSLEFAKLVVASVLYQYWGKLNVLLKTYLMVAVMVLITITSGGIYGYLSGAYQETATQSEFLDRQVKVIQQKQVRFEERKEDLQIEKSQIVKSISDLRVALSNPQQVQYVDRESGQLITTTSSSARRTLQKELKTSITERESIDTKLNAVTDSISVLDTRILDAQMGNESARELGPLKYMAELTNQPMGTIVNWFMLLIIFVFDPLAIVLVVVANMAFAQLKPKLKEETEEIEVTPVKQITEGGTESIRVITKNDELTEDEINEISKGVGKSEELTDEKPIEPTEEDLEKLAEALNIAYTDENTPIDRLADTTKTIIVNEVDNDEEKSEDSAKTLKYKGRT